MATKNKRTIFFADPAIEEWLRNEAFRLRISQGELIRRAVRLLMAGEAQVKWEKVTACNVVRPVLISAK